MSPLTCYTVPRSGEGWVFFICSEESQANPGDVVAFLDVVVPNYSTPICRAGSSYRTPDCARSVPSKRDSIQTCVDWSPNNDRRTGWFGQKLPYMFSAVTLVGVWRLSRPQRWKKSLLQELYSKKSNWQQTSA